MSSVSAPSGITLAAAASLSSLAMSRSRCSRTPSLDFSSKSCRIGPVFSRNLLRICSLRLFSLSVLIRSHSFRIPSRSIWPVICFSAGLASGITIAYWPSVSCARTVSYLWLRSFFAGCGVYSLSAGLSCAAAACGASASGCAGASASGACASGAGTTFMSASSSSAAAGLSCSCGAAGSSASGAGRSCVRTGCGAVSLSSCFSRSCSPDATRSRSSCVLKLASGTFGRSSSCCAAYGAAA